MGLLKPPYHFSLVMGVTGGISATPQNLRNQVGLLPEGSQWQLIGISKEQWPLIDLSLDLGGHIRRPVGPRGQLLPAQRRDGQIQRRASSKWPCRKRSKRARPSKVATVEEAQALIRHG